MVAKSAQFESKANNRRALKILSFGNQPFYAA